MMYQDWIKEQQIHFDISLWVATCIYYNKAENCIIEIPLLLTYRTVLNSHLPSNTVLLIPFGGWLRQSLQQQL